MSYIDDKPVCNYCLKPYPADWEACFIAPWPVTDELMNADGTMAEAEASNYHLCRGCLQALVISADLPRASRSLARRAQARWAASQALLAQCNAIGRASADAA